MWVPDDKKKEKKRKRENKGEREWEVNCKWSMEMSFFYCNFLLCFLVFVFVSECCVCNNNHHHWRKRYECFMPNSAKHERPIFVTKIFIRFRRSTHTSFCSFSFLLMWLDKFAHLEFWHLFVCIANKFDSACFSSLVYIV